MKSTASNRFYLFLISVLIILITLLHYNTSTAKWQFHLVYMQAYFIPILLAAFRFGKNGGLGSAVVISLLYLPHIMMQWGGLNGENLMRFTQIVLFNAIGYLTGLKAGGERRERRNAEQSAQRLQESLNDLKRKTEELLETERQLQAADRLATIGELTASLAHEVRNPLGSIRGAVEIIRDQVPKDVRKMEFFDILIQDTKRIDQVVENYLSFAAPHAGRTEVFDLAKILNNINVMVGARMRKSNIGLIIETEDAPLEIRGNPGQVWQAILNVTLNALEASPEEGKVTMRARRESEHIRLAVIDQGPGISRDQIPRLFESFYTTKADGSGLGLPIVKRLAEQNNWEIKIHSEPPAGAEFVFYFPAAN